MRPSVLLRVLLCSGAAAYELTAITQLLAQPDTAAAGLSALAAAALAGGAAARVAPAGSARRAGRQLDAPYAAGPQTYDPRLADEFYAARPLVVGGRLVRLGALTFGFNIKLLLDFLAYKAKGSPEGQPWPNEAARAREALGLSTKLGPTFIKLAQALSIRTDLIPEAYALELRQLQDAVPPFDSAEAMLILAYELGLPGGTGQLREVFPDISPKPIASASIGQVYRATTPDGRRVAVKVQRPGILSEIALDLHVLRLLAPVQTVVSNAINRLETRPRDLQLARELVDEWGRGFVAEADYKHEARSTTAFRTAMRERGLGAVTAPEVLPELSTSKVLVTRWVEGTRLDRDASPDVPRLCGVAINAYMTMLLDTGVLHCDPHPGNLLRTPEGELCILDWGMTLPVPTDLQYSLIEFIAHVNAEDYDAMPEDFVALGFTPADQLDRVKQSNLGEGLAFVLRQLSAGGGSKKVQGRVLDEWRERYGAELSVAELREAARADMQQRMTAQLASEGVDVNAVTNVMEEMSRRNRDMFVVPPYILYVARAFSTLEGIGLSANEDYSLVSEAFPYLSRRLLVDSSPRARAALRAMVYGPEGGSATVRKQPLARLAEMSDGFQSYASSTGSASRAPGSASSQELVDVLLSAEGGYVQELLVEEAAKLADALVRGRIETAASSGPAAALLRAMRAPAAAVESVSRSLPSPVAGVVRGVFWPAAVLDEAASLVSDLAGTRDDDKQLLQAADTLWQRLGASAAGGDGPLSAAERLPRVEVLFGELLEADSPLRRRLPVVGSLSRRFGATLLRRVAERLDADASRAEARPLSRSVVAAVAPNMRSVATIIQPANAEARTAAAK